jgi:PAS domain-containing protein
MAEPRRYFSLAGPYTALVGLLVIALVVFTVLLGEWFPDTPILVGSLALVVGLPLALYLVRRQFRPMLSLFRALAGTVGSYRDGDFSFSLRWPRHDELGELVDAHNALGDVLRDQRLGLVQRELLLDTMVQNTPVAMLLVAESGPIVYANIAARQLLNQGRKLEGHALTDVLARAAAPLRDAIDRGGDGLFSVGARTRRRSTTSPAAASCSTAASTSCCCCGRSPSSCAGRKCRPGRRSSASSATS